jgi:DHA2 family multidrug resistance protein-like MFS transporter
MHNPEMSAATSGAAGDAAPSDGLPIPRRYWSIATIVLATAMSVLDSSIANVALPSIARDFQTSEAASIWVVNAYQMAVLVALLPLASLGEIVGYRRVSQAGLAIFTLASLACAFAPSLVTLSVARVCQGIGAAGIMSVSAALVRFTYPQRLLGTAVGINAFVVSASAAIGPTIAAGLLAVGDWRWLFAVNVPLGLIAFTIAMRALPDTQRVHRPLNRLGALLYVGTFGLLASGLQAFAHDEATALAVAQLAGGCAFAVALVRHELARDSPLIPFDLLRSRLFSLSVLTSICSFTAQGAALVSLPFEIERLGRSAVETGLLMTPWPVAAAFAAPLAGRLSDRYPSGILGSIGLITLSIGLALLAYFPADGTAADFVWRMALCGLGFGFFQSPNNRELLLSAPRARSGAAGGMLGTARLLGQTLGAAGVAILFRAFPGSGSNLALTVSAVIALAAALVSSMRISRASH